MRQPVMAISPDPVSLSCNAFSEAEPANSPLVHFISRFSPATKSLALSIAPWKLTDVLAFLLTKMTQWPSAAGALTTKRAPRTRRDRLVVLRRPTCILPPTFDGFFLVACGNARLPDYLSH